MADGGPAPSTSTALVPLGHISDDITNDILAGMKRKLDQVSGNYIKEKKGHDILFRRKDALPRNVSHNAG